MFSIPHYSLIFLPSVALSNRDDLPEKPGIYYAVDRWGQCRYVGMSNNLYHRWTAEGNREHHKLAILQNFGKVRLYYQTMPLYRVEYEEAVEIQRFRRMGQADLNNDFPNPETLINFGIRFDQFVAAVGWTAVSAGLASWIWFGALDPMLFPAQYQPQSEIIKWPN